MREVVHVETQEQYDYVIEKLNYNWDENKWLDERENTCLRIDDEMTYDSLKYYTSLGCKIISFDEFKLRYRLKIGDTFEYNGFICRVESGVEKWVYDKYQEAYYKTIQCNSNYKEITNKEFIKQLEENAL